MLGIWSAKHWGIGRARSWDQGSQNNGDRNTATAGETNDEMSWDCLQTLCGELQDWKGKSMEWIEKRSKAAEMNIEGKLKSMLKEFCNKSGRWDIESLKIALTEVMTTMKVKAETMET